MHILLFVGIWSKHLLTQLRASEQTLEKTLKVVYRIVREQPGQYTNNGVPDICWAKDVDFGGGNLLSPPALPDTFYALLANMSERRKRRLLYTCTALSAVNADYTNCVPLCRGGNPEP